MLQRFEHNNLEITLISRCNFFFQYHATVTLFLLLFFKQVNTPISQPYLSLQAYNDCTLVKKIYLERGLKIRNDPKCQYFRPFLSTFHVPTIFTGPVTSDILGLFWTPLPKYSKIGVKFFVGFLENFKRQNLEPCRGSEKQNVLKTKFFFPLSYVFAK